MNSITLTFDLDYFERLVAAASAAINYVEEAIETEACRSKCADWKRVDELKMTAAQYRVVRNDLSAIHRITRNGGDVRSYQGFDVNEPSVLRLSLTNATDKEDDYFEAVEQVRSTALDRISGSVDSVAIAFRSAYKAFQACNRIGSGNLREFTADVDDALSHTPFFRNDENIIEARVELLSVDKQLEPYAEDEFHVQFKFRLGGSLEIAEGLEIVYLHDGKILPVSGEGSRMRGMFGLTRCQERSFLPLLKLALASMPFPTAEERAKTWT